MPTGEHLKGIRPHNWNGGSYISSSGYRLVLTRPGDKNYTPEHRLVMEQHLGRGLRPNEIVHHNNEDKLDNRLANLELMTRAEHALHHRPVKARTDWVSRSTKCHSCGTVFAPRRKPRGRHVFCSRPCFFKWRHS